MPGPATRQAPPQVTPLDIWKALRNSGASAVQAAGIMGNWISESGLDPESHAQDSNGYVSYGLAQWNTAPGNYPAAGTLVTGDAKADLNAQVRFLAQTGGLAAAKGSTPQQAAASYAANYERCQTCAGGGAQSTTRQAQAATVAGWAAAGNWPATGPAGTDTASLTAAAKAQSSATCLWQLPSIDFGIGSIGGECIMSKSQARAIEGVGLMTGGAVVLGFGFVLMLVGTALASSGVRKAAEMVPGAGGVAVAAASAGERQGDKQSFQRDRDAAKRKQQAEAKRVRSEQTAQERHTASQYRKQSRARENYARDNAGEPVPF
jgi:Phage tail lysozyme